MIRKLTVAGALIMVLGAAPALMANTRIYVRPYPGYYFGPTYWPAAPWYPSSHVYFASPTTGELKINTDDKDARVYVDGGYLGTVRKAKKFDLRPGNHDIELRDARGNVLYREKVAIVPGHTTDFNADGIGD